MVTKRPAPFTVTLTEQERERFEAHRVALGERSLADVIRHWIAAEPVLTITSKDLASLPPEVWHEAMSHAKVTVSGVPVLRRPNFNPQPKKR